MQGSEFHKLSDEELETKLSELKQELFNLRFQHATGQLENTGRLSAVRRNIARVKTILRGRR